MAENETTETYDPVADFDQSLRTQSETTADIRNRALNTNELKQTLLNMSSGAFKNVKAGSILPKSDDIQIENQKKFARILNRHKINLMDINQFETAYLGLQNEVDEHIRNGGFWKHQDLMPYIFDQMEMVKDGMVEQRQLKDYSNEIEYNVGTHIPSLFKQADALGGFHMLDDVEGGGELKDKIMLAVHSTLSKTDLLQNLDASKTSAYVNQYMTKVNQYDESLENFLNFSKDNNKISVNDWNMMINYPEVWTEKQKQDADSLENMVLAGTPYMQQLTNHGYIIAGINNYTDLYNNLIELQTNPPEGYSSEHVGDEWEEYETILATTGANLLEQRGKISEQLTNRLIDLYEYKYGTKALDGTLHNQTDMEFKKLFDDMNSNYYLSSLWDYTLGDGGGTLEHLGIDMENIKSEALGYILDDADITDLDKLNATHYNYYENVWLKENPEWVEQGKGFSEYIEAKDLKGKPSNADFGFDQKAYERGLIGDIKTDNILGQDIEYFVDENGRPILYNQYSIHEKNPEYHIADNVSNEGGDWKSWVVPGTLLAYAALPDDSVEKISKFGNNFRKGVMESAKYLQTNHNLTGDQITKFFTSESVDDFYRNINNYDDQLKNLDPKSAKYKHMIGKRDRAINHFARNLQKVKEFNNVSIKDIKNMINLRSKYNIFRLRHNTLNYFKSGSAFGRKGLHWLWGASKGVGKPYAPYGIALAINDALGFESVQSQITAIGGAAIAKRKFWPTFQKILNSPKAKKYMLKKFGKSATKKIAASAAAGLGFASWATTLVGIGLAFGDAWDLYQWVMKDADLEEFDIKE